MSPHVCILCVFGENPEKYCWEYSNGFKIIRRNDFKNPT